MAKYDDFGRPIYETAEEYNKAHKGGVCPRTYDSPTGENYQRSTRRDTQQTTTATQRFVNQERSKNVKPLIIGIALFFMILNVGLIISIITSLGFSFESNYEVNEENWVESLLGEDYYEEYPGDDSTPLPSGFETFTYNGQTYTLPESYEQLVDEGVMEDGDYFYIENPSAYDEAVTVPDFVFGDGLTFESSYEEVEAYLGIPYYHYEDYSDAESSYDNYEWCYNGDDETHYISVAFLDGVIVDVMIDKTVYEE